jgi:RNA polymerase sigma factor (TIGR02999 family)
MMPDVTRLLEAAASGDARAAADLLPLVYDELRRVAAAQLAIERVDHTLDPTALVHEAYLRLVGDQKFDTRGHFFAAAAQAMRRILVDMARRKKRVRHGGAHRRLDLDADSIPLRETPTDLVALDGVLTRFAIRFPIHSQLVELRYFAGLTGEQAALALGISASTADRHWVFARAWLQREMLRGENSPNS